MFFLLFPVFSFGQQNLILNGDFEEYWECPDDATQIERCKYAYNPCASVPSTSDYFNACYTTGTGAPVGVPNTFNGYQNSKSGNGMVGLGCVDEVNFQYREYVQISFSKPLECGRKYLFEGYFNLGNIYRYTIQNIGFLFSKEKINSNDYLYHNYTPQYIDSFTLIDDTLNWTKISFEYVADAPYSFLTVGHFLKDSTKSYVEVNPQGIAQDFSTYLNMDDFSLTELENVSVQFPNVFTPNNDGINDLFEPIITGISDYKVYIYNRWGNKVWELNSVTPFWDGKYASDGVYFYTLESKEIAITEQGFFQLIR